MANNNDSKRIVPWISMEEWNQVYKMIYSDDYNQRLHGLRIMTVWKSRVAKLTLGIECSLYLLQAILKDQEFREEMGGSLTENDVALMYSTAIIRFINLISHLGQVDLRHQPISAIAEMVGIPDWVVSIRHEATHAKMPSLGILRPGAKLAMEWLEENYWRAEEEDSFDLYWPESKKDMDRMIRERNKGSASEVEEDKAGNPAVKVEIIPEELYVTISMLVTLLNESPGRQWLPQLPSKPLRRFSYELWLAKQPEKTQALPLTQKQIDSVRLSLDKVRRLVLAEVERVSLEWAESLGPDVTGSSKEEMKAYMGQCLVSALCQCPELLNGYKSGHLADYATLWKLAHKWRCVPLLMEKLAGSHQEDDDKKRAALLHLISDLAAGLLHVRDHPDDQTNGLKFAPSIQSYDWRQTIRSLLKDPSAGTWDAVSKLFLLLDPPVGLKTQNKVADLLKVYLDSEIESTTPNTKVYTVEMIQSQLPVKITTAKDKVTIQSPAMNQVPDAPSLPVDTWTPCTEYDWSQVPIGSLPSRAIEAGELELANVRWERVEPEYEEEETCRMKKRTGERFDWNSLVRKRRRRGGLPKDATVDI